MKTVQIICPDNNAGLTRDRDIIKSILEPHFWVTLSDSRATKIEPFDIDIYVEHLLSVNPKSKHKILIPNPEWFEVGWKPRLDGIDMVMAKTRDCQNIFKRLHPNVVFTSFTSEDRYLPDVKKEKRFFHSCGKSQSKGTNEVLKLWGEFRRPALPPLPKLQFYSRPEMIEWGFFSKPNFTNIDVNIKFIKDDVFKLNQNSSLIHICTSIYEGFGHYINEVKSCGNVVITTNAAPMNELITPKMGVLAKCLPFKKMQLADCYMVSDRYLRTSVDKVLAMSEPELLEMGQHARQSFLDNDKFFRNRFLTVIKDLK